MTQAFEGLKILEVTDGMAGALAGGVLADNGADVVKAEPPGGDWIRAYPGSLTWNRGKRSIVLDPAVDEDRNRLRELASAADVVLVSSGDLTGTIGLGYEDLSRVNPGVVVATIKGFDLDGREEWDDRTAYEAFVVAKCGRFMGNDALSGAHNADHRPVYLAAPFASYGAAMLAVQGVSAALIQRVGTGTGQRVETSLLDGLSAATMRLSYQRDGDTVIPAWKREGAMSLLHRGIQITFLTVECKDHRYIQMCARMPHTFKNWLRALDLAYLSDDPRYAEMPYGLQSEEDAAEIEALLRERMLTKTQQEWMRLFIDDFDVGADPFLTFDEFLNHPQMTQNGRVVTVDDPEHGTVTEVGPLVNFAATPSTCDRPAPALGADQAQLDRILASWREQGDSPPAPSQPRSQQAVRPPLEGLTILEAATFIAAPLGATILAELGARVIKVEPLEGDAYRRAGLEAAHVTHGKESIALDLKTPEGQEIAHRLVERCDALLHNFRPGAPERLGLGYDQLTAINPKLVYLYGASYGSRGPESHRSAFHSTPNALCGGGILQAGAGNPPVDDSYPDPCAGLATGTALAIGLLVAARFGTGQYLETMMLSSSGWVHSNRLTLGAGLDAGPIVDRAQHGLHALYRLYRCSEGWLLLAAPQQRDWEHLLPAVGLDELADDARFADHDARMSYDDELTALLTDRLATRSAGEWEKALGDAGISAASAADYSFEEFCVAQRLVGYGEHPAWGSYWRLRPRVRFPDSANRLGEPSVVGEHTRSLLKEVEYTDDEIERLLAGRVVGAPS